MGTNEAELDCIEIDNSVIELLFDSADAGNINAIELNGDQEED